jgi:hypothetical protein
MMVCYRPAPDVIPAQAGIHVRQFPGTQWLGMASRMDSGLRRNVAVLGPVLCRFSSPFGGEVKIAARVGAAP